MLKEHKNSLYKIINRRRLDFSLFNFRELENNTVVIELRNSPHKFMLKQAPDNFDTFSTNNTQYKPGYPLRIDMKQFEDGGSQYPFKNIEAQLTEWLNEVVI